MTYTFLFVPGVSYAIQFHDCCVEGSLTRATFVGEDDETLVFQVGSAVLRLERAGGWSAEVTP